MNTAEAIAMHQKECNETRAILKKAQALGPWMSEPDRLEFKYKGLDCLLSRSSNLFNWCGYVGVSKDHPLFGKDNFNDESFPLDAHGGITYAEECGRWICHITEEEDNLWWFGFDCGHCYDLVPMMALSLSANNHGIPSFMKRIEYRDLNYAKQATEYLAEQLVKIAQNPNHICSENLTM